MNTNAEMRWIIDCMQYTLEKAEWTINNGQSRDIDNIGNTRHTANKR